MTTTQMRIRPRVRAAEPALLYDASARVSEPVGQPPTAEDSMPPLIVLARLPEISIPPDQTRLSLRLDWLKRLDWQQVRRIKFDPNWVAGGVLSLVLLLLLVITFNRSSKPVVEPTSTNEAPAWNTAGKTPSSSMSTERETGAPVSASTASPSGNEAGPFLTGDTSRNQIPGDNGSYTSDPAIRRLAAESSGPGAASLDGISYPRTPHPAIAAQPASNLVANQSLGTPFYGDEIRTAQRDVIAPYQPPPQVAPTQSGQAHFQGRITSP